MICSPWQLKRKCPGSMTPAWTGPTATSWILRAGHREEIGFPDGGAGGREANRLQPGMALRIDAPLLMDLALKMVRRGAVHRQRRIGRAHDR